MRPVLLVCEDCGTPYAGQSDGEGALRVQGGPDCPRCEGANLREVTSEDISRKAVEGGSR